MFTRKTISLPLVDEKFLVNRALLFVTTLLVTNNSCKITIFTA